MGGVLTLDAAFLGSVPADLGKALLERARADCGPVLHRAIESMREPLATMAGYHPWLVERRSIHSGRIVGQVFSRRPCLRGGRGLRW